MQVSVKNIFQHYLDEILRFQIPITLALVDRH